MEDGVRSGGHSGVLVKNRNSSGCLIVKKKGDGVGATVGSSGSRKPFESKKEKKRPRLVLRDSSSSEDECLVPPRRRVGPETIRVCNGLNAFEKGSFDESGISWKKNNSQYIDHDEDLLISRGMEDEFPRKRSKLDVFEFNEYDGIGGEVLRRKHVNENGSMHLPRNGIEREGETSSGRHLGEKRKNLYLDRSSGFNRDYHSEAQIPTPLLREKFMGHSDEPIRVQGKNGVLKVMIHKKKNVGPPLEMFDHRKFDNNRMSLRAEDVPKRNVVITPPPSVFLEPKTTVKRGPFASPEKDRMNLQTSLSTKSGKGLSGDSGDSDVSLKPGAKATKAIKPMKRAGREVERTPFENSPPDIVKEGKVKHGSGTEKQKLRERIRGMLLEAGWTIDYRPRRNRDYLDAVYINPSGTAYWSIIKAYDALQKQLNEEADIAKALGDGSSFAPIADEVLGQLTRKTRKKMEKQMKRKQREYSDSQDAKEVGMKSVSTKYYAESMDSDSQEEKLISFLKQGSKSLKNRANENGSTSGNPKVQNSNNHLHGRKTRKLGLLVRGSNKGLNSESDGFVPYTGKRTLLSWLIDSGTVQLSQKVRYMNRRQTRVMLEGWITKDGIHCGCCSKILTVSKFEVHAGSKLRQPFQNIFLESGVSLLQCQIDAWNKQEESKGLGFNSIEIDGDDPNDDTCGICADGGDLICCDGCPSTFHQSCLDIQIPPGDWHCPNCTCKFCGSVTVDAQEGCILGSALFTCNLCEKKYHISCTEDTNTLPARPNSVLTSFCGQKCRELFEHLQKYLGVKHELDAGFSWSLVRRTTEDSDTSVCGLSHRVECNTKLIVALTVMDECFLPIVDRRSGVNIIHNVLYNCGSNFNRLNYNGFYTVVLERGDEIICAASIRFHGTELVEMPFIGTRHIYRRQGMCRRLLGAIETALSTFKVEKLVIPAVAELMHTWTVVFGFTSLKESLKEEMRSMNMLVFPGTDMLQKLLLEEENLEQNKASNTGELVVIVSGTDCLVSPLKDTSLTGSVAAIPEVKPSMSTKVPVNLDSHNGEKSVEDTNKKYPSSSDMNCETLQMKIKPELTGSIEETLNSDSHLVEVLPKSDFNTKSPSPIPGSIQRRLCSGAHSGEVPESDIKEEFLSPVRGSIEGTKCSDSHSGKEFPETDINIRCPSPIPCSLDEKICSDSKSEEEVPESDFITKGPSLILIPASTEERICSEIYSEKEFPESDVSRKSLSRTYENENNQVPDSSIKNNPKSSNESSLHDNILEGNVNTHFILNDSPSLYGFDDANDIPLDSNNHKVEETESKLSGGASLPTSDAIHCSASSLHASRTDDQEGRSESSSI